jgi:hypothetical protein
VQFPPANFTVMLFHYDGTVDRWRDLKWCDRAVHVAVRNQTKWWFAKRFLHPDVAAEYEYIFLWDEDIEVDSFDPLEYLRIVRREGLEISQPALDHRSQIHHRLTARARKGDVHRSEFIGSASDRASNCEINTGGRLAGGSTSRKGTGPATATARVRRARGGWR